MASSVATPLERRFGRIAGVTEITSTSSLGVDEHHPPVRPGPQRRRRRARRPGGHRRGRRRSCRRNLPSRPTYRKVNPADSPDPHPLADVRLAAAEARSSTTANTVLAQKISQVRGVGQVTVGGGQQPAVRVQVDPVALAGIGLSLEDVRKVLVDDHGRPAQGDPRRGRPGRARSPPTTSCSTPTTFKTLVLAYNNGTDRPARATSPTSSTTSRTSASPAGPTAIRAVVVIIRRQPDANIIETSERVQGPAPFARDVDLACHQDAGRSSTAPGRSAPRSTTSSTRWSSASCSWSSSSSSSCATFRATAIPSVAVPLSLVGDVRAHVPRRLQPRQPVAHGAHDLDRVRRRRRDRRDREHLALHRARRLARRGRARRGRSKSASPSSRSRSRSSRSSSRSCSWGASSGASSASSP